MQAPQTSCNKICSPHKQNIMRWGALLGLQRGICCGLDSNRVGEPASPHVPVVPVGHANFSLMPNHKQPRLEILLGLDWLLHEAHKFWVRWLCMMKPLVNSCEQIESTESSLSLRSMVAPVEGKTLSPKIQAVFLVSWVTNFVVWLIRWKKGQIRKRLHILSTSTCSAVAHVFIG